MMQRLQDLLPAYRAALSRYVVSDDDLVREEALAEATEIGKVATLADASIDEMREIHRQAVQQLVDEWRTTPAPTTTMRSALLPIERLAQGEAGPFSIAFILPNEMAQLRRHEQNWRREHGKLLALFEQSDDLMLVLNVHGQTESVNPAFCRATGWTPLEAVTQFAALWQGLQPTGATHLQRAQQARRNGSSFMVEWSISPILDDDGELLSHVCIGRDITREQQIEEGLRENDKLRAVATLAAGIAHDFNNLLGSINGLAELCELEATAGSRQARNLGRIRQAGDKAAALVRQMLDFSRQTPRATQRVAAGELLEHAGGLLRAALAPSVVLTISVLQDGPVLIDLVQMEQVLLNITRNAAQAMGEEGGHVQVLVDHAQPMASADTQEPAQRHLRLRVIDDGCGMPAELLPRIFDPFFTTKPVGEGTGLGLAAVHGIVSSHGGAIEVTSQVGQGSCFNIYLPLVTEAQDGEAAAEDEPGTLSLPTLSTC